MTLVRAETAGLHPLMIEMFRDLIAQARAGGVEYQFCGAGCCPAAERPTQTARPE